jgi:hypothetical protein
MKSLLILTTLCCIGIANAQKIGRLHLRENDDKSGGPTVVIDLTDPDIPPPPPLIEIVDPSETDKPSADKEKSGEEEKPKPADDKPAKSAKDIAPPEPPKDPEKGVSVHVSGFTGNASKVDPKSISLKAPFPAKPLGAIPNGWKLVRADDTVPIFDTKVEISSGSGLQLKVRPHVLIPDANGATIFAVGEPGFDPAKGYRQAATIGAILGKSIQDLKDDEKRMDGAIERLEQLLNSLPEPTPASPATPKRKSNRKS